MIRPGTARLSLLLIFAGICAFMNNYLGNWTLYTGAACFFLVGVNTTIEIRRNKKAYGTIVAPIKTHEHIRGCLTLIVAILVEALTFANLYFDSGREAKLQQCREILEMKEMSDTVIDTTVFMPNYYTTAVGCYCEVVLLMDDIQDCMNEILTINETGGNTEDVEARVAALQERAGELSEILNMCKTTMIVQVILIAANTVLYLMAKYWYYGYIFVKPTADEFAIKRKKKK